jgi:Xaa-Pro aminopeptidase
MLRRALRLTLAALLLLAPPLAPASHASEVSDDLKARRARVMERLGPDAMLILWSAPVRNYSLDVSYEYRQDSNLYYLTAMTQEDTVLVLMPGNRERREILFVRPRDPVHEHWTGRTMSREEASAHTGIATVMTTAQFEPFVAAMLSQQPFGEIAAPEAEAFSAAVGANRARVALLLGPRSLSGPLTAPLEFVGRIRDRFFGFQPIDATPILTDLRMVKTPVERQLLVKSLEISNDAQLAGMRAARPGAFEYEVEAAIEAVHHARGAVSWSYPSIVGSGPNATILHYTEGTRQMQAGELLLVDAAANYQYMSGDITRTYPVSGTFTEAQREIYALVLRAQEESMKVAQAGSSLRAIHDKAVEVLKAGLLTLGLIADQSGDQYRMWFTHGTSHYIGIDVHDVGPLTRPLQPGMAFVIEPGVYIRRAALEGLPRTPDNLELLRKIEPAVAKYDGIGIRIEDAFLLEESGLRRLTTTVPRTLEEVEAFMKQRRPATP